MLYGGMGESNLHEAWFKIKLLKEIRSGVNTTDSELNQMVSKILKYQMKLEHASNDYWAELNSINMTEFSIATASQSLKLNVMNI